MKPFVLGAASAALLAPFAAAQAAGETPLRFGDPPEIGYDEPFFPGAEYDPDVPTPDALLGQPHGTRLSHHAEILQAFRLWDEVSPRLTLRTYARSHEGRELVYAVVTSPENQARLGEIRAGLGHLFDPRGLSDPVASQLLRDTPPVAWMSYSIHGDELSGCDAAVALGYHLTAARGPEVERLLERLVVVIDPIQNPDGRERIIAMVEQSAGRTPNLDDEGMQRGHWPYGRGNHYLFDMNRDWMAGTQPETRGRWRAIRDLHPQLLVDAHEMGSLDTFLFYPQAAPLLPHLSERHLAWQRAFAEGAARAFDARGWTYYTREWADGWAPFYTDAWASLGGAIGMLYEQAGTAGFPLRRASGRIATYREAVHHQLTASWANLNTLAERRDEVLADFLANQRRNVAADTPGNDRMFVLPPNANGARTRQLVRTLAGQGIEVFRAAQAFEAANALGHLGDVAESKAFPGGSLIVPARQPLRQMVRAYLEFDERMDAEALKLERQDLERKGRSRIYDLSSWSLAHAFDLEAWWCDAREVQGTRVMDVPAGAPTLVDPDPAAPTVGWIVDGGDDASVAFAARALELGLQVHVADEAFGAAPVHPPGSLLVRAHENEGTPAELQEKVLRAATEAGVAVVELAKTSLSATEGADLGGQHFHLLARPRVALLSNAPIAPDTYGHLWHHLDTVLGLPFTILEAHALGSYDLRRYNVLIVPPSWGGLGPILAASKEELEAWVRGGGTLIACGDAAAALTSGAAGLSTVALRQDALEELETYRAAARREWEAREVEVDEAALWGEGSREDESGGEDAAAPSEGADADADADSAKQEEDKKEEGADEEAELTAEEDAWQRTFSPHGVTLRGLVYPEEWITVGCGEELPVLCDGPDVFLSKPPVRTPVRLAPAERLRLAGLLWPEARERLAESAWLTVEPKGNGQIVLFASIPAFRGYHTATARLFSNAVVFGPGVGASQPLGR